MHGLQACLFKCITVQVLLHSPFMLCEAAVKGAVGGHALNSHGNYIVDHGKS